MSGEDPAGDLFRVSIAVPSGDMVHAAFAMCLAELCHASQRLTLQLTNVRSSIVALARNNAVEAARQFGAGYLLFLDGDMTFPPSTLLRLLLHRKDVVGATYVKRVPPFDVLGTALGRGGVSGSGEEVVEMARMPTGCLLLDMRVFDKLAKPYFHFVTDRETATITGEDYVFCDAVRAAGLRIFCDPALSLELGHIGQSVFRIPHGPAGGEPAA